MFLPLSTLVIINDNNNPFFKQKKDNLITKMNMDSGLRLPNADSDPYCSVNVVLSQGGEREILAVKSRWQILLRGQPGSCKGDLQVSNPLETHQGLIIRPVQFLLLCLPDGHGLAAARRRRPPSVQVPLDPARLVLPLLPLRQKTIKSYPHVCKGCCWSLC